jgi:DNA-directed RNA polymerase subunit RPC12/RpoP
LLADYDEGRRQKETEDLIKTLDQEIEKSIGRAKQISKDQDIVWHDEINFLAEKIERKYQILDQDWAISNISQEITRLYREQDIKIWPHVYKYLPPRFKDNQFIDTINRAIEQFTSSSQHSCRNLLEELKIFKKSGGIAEIPREQVSEYENVIRNLDNGLKKRAEQEHIALESEADKDKQQSQPVTTDHPQPRGSKTREAVGRCIKVFQEIYDRVFDFPPEILEKDDEIAEGFDTIPALFKPGLDLKYSKNWLDWWRAEKYRDIYGKHAAGVMSFSVTNLCANCSDENTREWVRMEPVSLKAYDTYECFQCGYRIETVCPACNLSMKLMDKPTIGWQCHECGNTTPMTRDLTREQIGDKTSIVMEAAIKILDHIPFLMSFCSWFRDWSEPYVAGRKIRLSGPLSDRA